MPDNDTLIPHVVEVHYGQTSPTDADQEETSSIEKGAKVKGSEV